MHRLHPAAPASRGRKSKLLSYQAAMKPFRLGIPFAPTRGGHKPRKEERKMKKILGPAILAGAFAVMAALPVTATAGPAGRGRAMGNGITTQTHAGEQIRVRQHPAGR